jgi:hypothetical protein
MSKNRLTIKRESTPTRCEICHQSDLFDPATGECQRCATIRAILPSSRPSTPTFASTRAVSAAVAGIIALFSCIFFWRVGMFIAIVAVILGSRELTALRQQPSGETRADHQRVGEAFAFIGIYGGTLAGLIAIAASIAACWLIH